jgi:hypothetical protein
MSGDGAFAIPKTQRRPRWVPAVDGRAKLPLGVYDTCRKAIAAARLSIPTGEWPRAGAVRVWVAFER